jgi:hypothetical protein
VPIRNQATPAFRPAPQVPQTPIGAPETGDGSTAETGTARLAGGALALLAGGSLALLFWQRRRTSRS